MGLVVAGDLDLRINRVLGENSAVQASLVAKIVADGGHIGAGCLRQFARRGIGVTLFGKQADGAMQQTLARLLAVGTGLASIVGGWGVRIIFFNHGGDLIIYLKRLI